MSYSQQPGPHKPAAPQPKNRVLAAFQDHQLALRRYIARMVRRADIDDIAQETFLRAYQAEKNNPTAIEQPKSFLFKIAHNLAITSLTRKSSQMLDYLAEVEDVAEPAAGSALLDEVIGRQMVGIHCEAVAALPPQCRKVYLLRKVHGLSHREIADHLGISNRTVEKHISKGVKDCANYVRQCTREQRAQQSANGSALYAAAGDKSHG